MQKAYHNIVCIYCIYIINSITSCYIKILDDRLQVVHQNTGLFAFANTIELLQIQKELSIICCYQTFW